MIDAAKPRILAGGAEKREYQAKAKEKSLARNGRI
jgi:hypothetical protein